MPQISRNYYTMPRTKREGEGERGEETCLSAIHFRSTLWKPIVHVVSRRSRQSTRQSTRQSSLSFHLKHNPPPLVYPPIQCKTIQTILPYNKYDYREKDARKRPQLAGRKGAHSSSSSWLGHWLIDDVSDTINVIVIVIVILHRGRHRYWCRLVSLLRLLLVVVN